MSKTEQKSKIRLIKPMTISNQKTELGCQEELFLNQGLVLLHSALNLIDTPELATKFYSRVRQPLAEFERLWVFGKS